MPAFGELSNFPSRVYTVLFCGGIDWEAKFTVTEKSSVVLKWIVVHSYS